MKSTLPPDKSCQDSVESAVNKAPDFKTPVVMTTGFHYSPFQADVFFRSLSSHFSGQVILFTDKPWNIPSDKYPFSITNLYPKKHPEIFHSPLAFNSSNNLRYFLYRNFLNNCPWADAILFSDLRDVLFQSNPFGLLGDSRLHVAGEPVTLRECGSNAGWFDHVYGNQTLESFGSHHVICSGTTLGTKNVVISYLDRMCEQLEQHGQRLDIGPNTTIIDQAIHIKTCHEISEQIFVHTLDKGLIATFHYAANLLIDRQSRMLNSDGIPYAIVHQYDRIRQLRQVFYDRFEHKSPWDVDASIRQYLASSDTRKATKLFRHLLKSGPSMLLPTRSQL